MAQVLLPSPSNNSSVPQSSIQLALFPLFLDDSASAGIPVISTSCFDVGLDTGLPSIRRFSWRTFKWIVLARICVDNIIWCPEPNIELGP